MSPIGRIYREMTTGPRNELAKLMSRVKQYRNNKQEPPAALLRQVDKANAAFNKANNEAMAKEYASAKGHLERPPQNTHVYMGDPTLIERMRGGGMRSNLSLTCERSKQRYRRKSGSRDTS